MFLNIKMEPNLGRETETYLSKKMLGIGSPVNIGKVMGDDRKRQLDWIEKSLLREIHYWFWLYRYANIIYISSIFWLTNGR